MDFSFSIRGISRRPADRALGLRAAGGVGASPQNPENPIE